MSSHSFTEQTGLSRGEGVWPESCRIMETFHGKPGWKGQAIPSTWDVLSIWTYSHHTYSSGTSLDATSSQSTLISLQTRAALCSSHWRSSVPHILDVDVQGALLVASPRWERTPYLTHYHPIHTAYECHIFCLQWDIFTEIVIRFIVLSSFL